jgi:3-methyladenine DNA glycosylase/8-oxoguanine DNA glycosylase
MMMGSRLTIRVPADYLLRRDLCSYGYFLLDPNFWDPARERFTRVLELAGGPVRLEITQPGSSGGSPLRAVASRVLTRAEQDESRRLITRMLRLDESAEVIASFHQVDPRLSASGRGRLMRSPTFFEDVIKTVTSCNVTWPSTVSMNRRLCEVIGRAGAFPTARQLARVRPATLRARCRVGYRDARIIELARLFASGKVEPRWFEDPATPDALLRERLLELPGIGPYAAANIMQLLGRYHLLPLDTESVRHGRNILGYAGSDAHVMKSLHSHYAPFGRHAFRSYWFELWDFYESLRGPAHMWERQTTGQSFTASKLKPSPSGQSRGMRERRAPTAGAPHQGRSRSGWRARPAPRD